LLPLSPAGKPPGIDDLLHQNPTWTAQDMLRLAVAVADLKQPENYRDYPSVKVEIEENHAVLWARNTVLDFRTMEEVKSQTFKAITASQYTFIDDDLKTKSGALAWLADRNRKTYRTLVFEPTERLITADNSVNLFRGLAPAAQGPVTYFNEILHNLFEEDIR